MDANAGENPGSPDLEDGTVPVREDFIEALQCPVCQLFFGLYLALPLDPTQSLIAVPVPPEKVKEAHRRLIEHWKSQGTVVRDGSHGEAEAEST